MNQARLITIISVLLAACGSAQDESPGTEGGQSGAAGAPSNVAGAPSSAAGAGASQAGSGPAGAGAPAGGAAAAGGPNGGGAGKTGSAGAPAGGGGSTSTVIGPNPSCKAWPAATGSTQKLSKTQNVSKSFDGKLQRFVSDGLGDGAQGENQEPLFVLSDGATLENVIIGAPAADGIHCNGSCTLKNVWWEDVGEDAATFKGSSASQVMSIDCGGAKSASDKVFQHNGPGTMKISNFYVSSFGKLYRSCGNCDDQFAKHVIFSGIKAEGR